MAKYDWKIEPRDEDWSDDIYAFFLIHINIKKMAEYLNKEFKKEWWFKADFGNDSVWIVAEHNDYPVRLFFNFDEDGWANIKRHYTDGASYKDESLGNWHYAKYDVNYSFGMIKENIKEYFNKFEESDEDLEEEEPITEAKDYKVFAVFPTKNGYIVNTDIKDYQYIQIANDKIKNHSAWREDWFVNAKKRAGFKDYDEDNMEEILLAKYEKTVRKIIDNLIINTLNESKKSMKESVKPEIQLMVNNIIDELIGEYSSKEWDALSANEKFDIVRTEYFSFGYKSKYLSEVRDLVIENMNHPFNVVFESKKSARKSIKESSNKKVSDFENTNTKFVAIMDIEDFYDEDGNTSVLWKGKSSDLKKSDFYDFTVLETETYDKVLYLFVDIAEF